MGELDQSFVELPSSTAEVVEDQVCQDQHQVRRILRPFSALLLTGTLALSTLALHEEVSGDTASAQEPLQAQVMPVAHAVAAQSGAYTPGALAGQANTLVTSVSEAWAAHQLSNGNLLDPVEGRVGGYGVSMIGQAMIETGEANSNEVLIQDGINAELNEVSNPDHGGFEKFSLASAYIWNQAHLANDPNWQAAQTKVSSFLSAEGKPIVSSGAATCYAEQNCWNNLKLVNTFANIEQAATGLNGQSATASAKPEAVLTRATNEILEQASTNTGNDARRLGANMYFDDAGILSDPTKDPLAYHELSTMMLGHVIEALGSRTPGSVNAAFQRSARAIIGLMAPDGDGAYIGRGQGQVWNVAAMTDALAIAAHDTSNPVWRGRYLAGAARTLTRLETVYEPGSYGLALVPRLAGDPDPNYLGVDSYANTVEYNGLALWELEDAEQELQTTQPAPAEAIGADTNGVFIDPSHTQFAAVRKGNLWWAIHAGDTSVDARYDFGLVAAERLINGQWLPAMPYRPLTYSKTSGGPELILHNEHLVPEGKTIKATANGAVKIEGGWSTSPGGAPSVDKHTQWTFQPAGDNGVNLSFDEKGNKTYQFQAWYEEGSKTTLNKDGISIAEPDGREESYSLNVPVSITHGPEYHSAYDENLDSSILTIHTKSGNNTIDYTTTF
jgi:hypothetical protein